MLRYRPAVYGLGSVEAGFEKNVEFVLVSEICAFPCPQSLLFHALTTVSIQGQLLFPCAADVTYFFFWKLPTASLKLLARPLT